MAITAADCHRRLTTLINARGISRTQTSQRRVFGGMLTTFTYYMSYMIPFCQLGLLPLILLGLLPLLIALVMISSVQGRYSNFTTTVRCHALLVVAGGRKDDNFY